MEKIISADNNETIDDINPLFDGIPVEPETKDEWRKVHYSCSGAGRIPANFDTWHLAFMRGD